jgi:hypothetical protein
MNKAYVYKWVHKPSLKWYIGSHTGRDEHYICSSKLIKHHIVEFPNEWERQILAYGTPEEMYDLETEILQLTDAKHDPRSFNGHNNDGKFNTIGRTKEFMSESELANRKKVNAGKPKTKEHKKKLSEALKGRPNPRFAILFGKGIAKNKVVCRISDRKEMSLSHFIQYINRLNK